MEVLRRSEAGEDVPGPIRRQISGTVYFGLTNPVIVAAIERLDPERTCTPYWDAQAVRNPAQRRPTKHGCSPDVCTGIYNGASGFRCLVLQSLHVP